MSKASSCQFGNQNLTKRQLVSGIRCLGLVAFEAWTDICNKYIWIGVTDVHEHFLETADSPGCSASVEPADNCCKRWGSCPPAPVCQLQQVTPPRSTIATPWLDSWKKKNPKPLSLNIFYFWRLLDTEVYHHFILRKKTPQHLNL